MILVVILVVVGPERLPKVARQAGAAWREFTRVRQEVVDEVRAALPDTEDLPRIPRIPSVRGTLTDLITESADAGIGRSDGKGGNGTAARPQAGSPSSGNVRADAYVPSADDPSMN